LFGIHLVYCTKLPGKVSSHWNSSHRSWLQGL
jgi:hypothetical protein